MIIPSRPFVITLLYYSLYGTPKRHGSESGVTTDGSGGYRGVVIVRVHGRETSDPRVGFRNVIHVVGRAQIQDLVSAWGLERVGAWSGREGKVMRGEGDERGLGES